MNKTALLALSLSALTYVSCQQEQGDVIDGHAHIRTIARPTPVVTPVVAPQPVSKEGINGIPASEAKKLAPKPTPELTLPEPPPAPAAEVKKAETKSFFAQKQPVAEAPKPAPEVKKPEPKPVVEQKQPEVAPAPTPEVKKPEPKPVVTQKQPVVEAPKPAPAPEVKKPEPKPVISQQQPRVRAPRRTANRPTVLPSEGTPSTAIPERLLAPQEVVMPGQNRGGRRR